MSKRLKLHLYDRADFSKFQDASAGAQGLFIPGSEPPPVGQPVTVEVVFQGGREETRWQINACSLSRIVWGGTAAAGDPSFQFINRAGITVNELYVSLSSDRSWGTDRLGQGTLPPGAGFWVTLPGGKVCTDCDTLAA